MAQVFQVLQCYQCDTFQVQQRKKKSKWQCKICTAKQSVLKVFGEGVASDCRKHVQKLNMSRASEEQIATTPTLIINPPDLYATINSDSSNDSPLTNTRKLSIIGESGKGRSKWSTYTEPTEETSDDSDNSDDLIYVAERTKLEQVTRRMERGKKNSKKPRLTGFHPISTSGQSTFSPNTDTTPHNHTQSNSTYPYSTVSKDIDAIISTHSITTTHRKLMTSRSDNYLENIYGSYRPLSEDSPEGKRSPFQSSKSAGDLKGVQTGPKWNVGINANGVDMNNDCVGNKSKWSQFISDSVTHSSHSDDDDD